MGCDIHFYVEKREGPDAPWQSADKFTTEGTGEDAYTSNYDHQFYKGRNYGLFSILADVRNHPGGVIPIADPKGLPDDISEPTRAAAEYDGNDGHSHSYFTVSELLAFDWTQVAGRSGDVTLRELARWKLNGSPEMWSRRSGGGGLVDVASDRAVEAIERVIAGYKLRGEDYRPTWWTLFHMQASTPFGTNLDKLDEVERRFVQLIYEELGLTTEQRPNFQVTWGTPYYEMASEFLCGTMPKLWRLGAHDDVRIVFWFDN